MNEYGWTVDTLILAIDARFSSIILHSNVFAFSLLLRPRQKKEKKIDFSEIIFEFDVVWCGV